MYCIIKHQYICTDRAFKLASFSPLLNLSVDEMVLFLSGLSHRFSYIVCREKEIVNRDFPASPAS